MGSFGCSLEPCLTKPSSLELMSTSSRGKGPLETNSRNSKSTEGLQINQCEWSSWQLWCSLRSINPECKTEWNWHYPSSETYLSISKSLRRSKKGASAQTLAAISPINSWYVLSALQYSLSMQLCWWQQKSMWHYHMMIHMSFSFLKLSGFSAQLFKGQQSKHLFKKQQKEKTQTEGRAVSPLVIHPDDVWMVSENLGPDIFRNLSFGLCSQRRRLYVQTSYSEYSVWY